MSTIKTEDILSIRQLNTFERWLQQRGIKSPEDNLELIDTIEKELRKELKS